MTRKRHSRWTMLAAALALTLVSLACENVEDPLTAEASGTLTVAIHDQAGPGIAEAHVTFNLLEMRQADTGLWTTITAGDMPTVDLLLLVDGNEATLTTSPIPPGDYDGMRLGFESVSVVLDTQVVVDVNLPAGPVEVTGFPYIRVGDNGSATVVLDFSVVDSFTVDAAGNVTMTPTITVDRANAN